MLTATATRADADGDTVTLTYVWRVNGTIRKTTPRLGLAHRHLRHVAANNGNQGDTITRDGDAERRHRATGPTRSPRR